MYEGIGPAPVRTPSIPSTAAPPLSSNAASSAGSRAAVSAAVGEPVGTPVAAPVGVPLAAATAASSSTLASATPPSASASASISSKRLSSEAFVTAAAAELLPVRFDALRSDGAAFRPLVFRPPSLLLALRWELAPVFCCRCDSLPPPLASPLDAASFSLGALAGPLLRWLGCGSVALRRLRLLPLRLLRLLGSSLLPLRPGPGLLGTAARGRLVVGTVALR